MKIVVLVKEVPDTYGDRKLSLETGLADRAASETVLDEIGERALEVALSYADKNPDAEVVVLSMAPAGSAATVRKGLAMGAGSAVHVADEGLVGADLGLTAEVLAAAIRRTGLRPGDRGQPVDRRVGWRDGGDGRRAAGCAAADGAELGRRSATATVSGERASDGGDDAGVGASCPR